MIHGRLMDCMVFRGNFILFFAFNVIFTYVIVFLLIVINDISSVGPFVRCYRPLYGPTLGNYGEQSKTKALSKYRRYLYRGNV